MTEFTRRDGPDWFTDYMASVMRAATWGQPEPTPPDQIPAALGGTLTPEMTAHAMDQIWARKLSAIMVVPDELLMDAGIIPDTRPRVPIPWRTRLRYRIDDWRERMARRAYRLIAGYDPPEPEDY